MYAIRNYTNTKCELEMAKTRLNLLMDRKEKLYCKYFPLTPKLKDVIVDGGEHNTDKMADYLYDLHDVDIGTGKSLADEITFEQQNVDKLQGYLNDMNESLSKMTGKSVSKEREDKIIQTIIHDEVPKNVEKMF